MPVVTVYTSQIQREHTARHSRCRGSSFDTHACSAGSSVYSLSPILTAVWAGHDVAVRGGRRDHVMAERDGVLVMGHYSSPHPLVGTVVIIPVPCLLPPGVIQVLRVDRARFDLGEAHGSGCGVGLDVVCCVVQVGHGCHGIHGSRHGRGRDGFRFLYAGVGDLVGRRVVVWDVREDKGVIPDLQLLLGLRLLLGQSFIAVAPTDWVTGIVPAAPLLLVLFHLSPKHSLAWRDEGEPGRLELRGEQGSEDGRRARVVAGEAAIVGLGHVLLGTRDGVERFQSIGCPSQKHILDGDRGLNGQVFLTPVG